MVIASLCGGIRPCWQLLQTIIKELRSCALLLQPQSYLKIFARVCVGRVEGERQLERGDGPVEIPLLPQRVAQVDAGFDVGRVVSASLNEVMAPSGSPLSCSAAPRLE